MDRPVNFDEPPPCFFEYSGSVIEIIGSQIHAFIEKSLAIENQDERQFCPFFPSNEEKTVCATELEKGKALQT